MLKLDGAHVRNTSLPKTQRVQRQTPGPPLLLRSCSKGNTICFPNQKLRCSPHCGEAGCRRAGAHGAPSAPFPGTALPRLPPLADERLTLLLHPIGNEFAPVFSVGGGPRQLGRCGRHSRCGRDRSVCTFVLCVSSSPRVSLCECDSDARVRACACFVQVLWD